MVTAQKRSEDLQKVPISLQVLSGEKLEQLQVSDFDDYAKLLAERELSGLTDRARHNYSSGAFPAATAPCVCTRDSCPPAACTSMRFR